MRQRFWSIRAVLLSVIGLLTLTIFALAARDITAEWQKEQRIRALQEATMLSDTIFDDTETLSIERDLAFSALHTADKDILADLGIRLQKSRRDVDRTFADSMTGLEKFRNGYLESSLQKSTNQFANLQKLRQEIDAALSQPPDQRDHALSQRWFDDVTALIASMQGVWTDFSSHYADIDPATNMQMRFKYTLGIITEYSGRQRSLIGRLLAENVDPTHGEQADLLRWAGAVDIIWQISPTLAREGGLTPTITPYLEDARSHYFTVNDMVRDIFYIPGAHARPYPISVEFWLDLAMQANDALYALKDAALVQSHEYMDDLAAKARQSIIYHIAFLSFAFTLCLYTMWVIVYRVIRPINEMADALVSTTEGKPVNLTVDIEGRRDEIGKLAQGLRALQKGAEAIRRHAAEITHYAAALERSNHELDEFAHIASHDLKEPLRGLHRHAKFLLEDNKGKLDDGSVRRLGRLMSLSERMDQLISDLLYYSRLGNQELAIRPADPNNMIAGIRDMLEVFLAERHAVIRIPQPLPTLTCDAIRVTEVFRNLITNGVKYNDSAEKMVEIGYVASYKMAEGGMRRNVYYVRDNGHGIAPEFHKEIFRMFKRLPSAVESKEDGTGVGLTFVKKIIERHGGAIWLESAIGKGTTFYFTLTAETAEPQIENATPWKGGVFLTGGISAV